MSESEDIQKPNEGFVNDEETAAEKKPFDVTGLLKSAKYFFPEVKLSEWDPENEEQWNKVGAGIARRNLIASIPNLSCAFGIWLVWSVIVTKIQKMHDADPAVYPFEDWGSPKGSKYKSNLFLLPGIAGLSGGTLRIPNSFMTQASGGRNVVYSTTVLLCIPMVMAGIALQNNDCSFNVLLAAALLSGVGGGAFASSMSNINFYYPKRLQGYALGMNGGIGNLGVSISQLLAPIVMSSAYGKGSVAGNVAGWPANAGWLWFSLSVPSAVLAFLWMSNQPHHGSASWIQNHINFYWMEGVGMIAALIGMVILIFTRDTKMMDTAGGQVAQKFVLVLICAVLEHLFLWFITPKAASERVKKQAVIFSRKHTYIMTWLYIMCFGSFIGYSGSFPKLIVDLFGYVKGAGCDINGDIKSAVSSEVLCLAEGGEWKLDAKITNPNAPNGSAIAWLGAAVGSLIRPIGGVLADKFGGAKMTMIAIIWCTAAAFAQGALVQKTRDLEKPEKNFGWFVFLFLNLFLCTGFMNGTTFRTIGVLFPPEESGPVLGWSSAIASYGAFIIPTMFGICLQAGTPQNMFYCLGGYYITCGILNFWYYLRPGCEKPQFVLISGPSCGPCNFYSLQ